ncbi:unnamed protein product [Paramecium pentaurelia]|uniref:EGF-like domain-containing protein n=1 Tax=Paramecium pentaurelia TaxID=43138 RepID=A0A8S1WUF7_9CILI|nr:unnamed protein product [Paramecium pentaurelia]
MKIKSTQGFMMIVLIINCFYSVCNGCPIGCRTCGLINDCWTCNQGYYYELLSCKACSNGCQDCSSSTSCSQCYPSYVLQNSKCNLQCQQNCLSCNTTTTCITCVNGYYADINQQCQQCTIPCQTCYQSSTNCQSCNDPIGMIVINSQCVCKDGYFKNSLNICQQCTSPCLKCIDNENKCMSCITTYNYFSDSNTCKCLNGQYEINQSCQACQLPCSTCELSASNCLSCIDSNQTLNGQNQCICNDGFVQIMTHCEQCISPCVTCTQSTTFCQSCIDINHELINGTCTCKSGYLSLDSQVCLKCNSNCITCSNNIDYCDSCVDINKEINGLHQCICKQGFYFDPNYTICQECDNSCAICDINMCLQCKRGYGKTIESLKYCLPCHYPCLDCQENVDFCNECDRISLFYLENQECKCPDGYYSTIEQCQKCSNECEKCSQTSEYCLSCIDYNYQFFENTCICPYGYYIDTALNCQQCQQRCESCQFNFDYCLSCSHSLQILINNQCQCIDGYTYIITTNQESDNICHQCQDIYQNCLECNQIQCNKCQQGYYQNEIQDCIITICGDQIKVENEQCEDGNDGCFNCQCELGWIQNETGCYSICGDGIQVKGEQCDDANNIQYDGCYECQYDCNINCQQCDQGVCQLCKQGFLLDDNQCISTCGDGILDLSKEQCDDNNNLPRDGCYNCFLEDGFICQYNDEFLFQSCNRCLDINCITCTLYNEIQICQKCIEGYFIDQYNSCSQCDQICIDCINTSKNCITFDYEIYQLKVCNQSEGYYYNFTLKDCQSICGDGIITKQEQCDDYNTLDYDGCNSKCQIESGFLFDIENNRLINEPYIQVEFNQSHNNQYSIIADQFQESINCTATTLNIERFNQTEYNFTITQTGDNCDINMIFTKTIEPINLIHIFVKYKGNYKKRILDEDFQQEVIIVPVRQIYVNQEQKEQGQKMAAASKALSSSIAAFAPLALIVGGFKFIWAILDILSWMNNFYFLNVNYPENVRLIFQQAEWSNIINFPSINILNQPSDNYYFQAQPKFTEKDVDPLFFNNIQIVIIFLFQVIITKLICFTIRKVLQTYYKKLIVLNQKKTIFQLSEFQIDIQKQDEQQEQQLRQQKVIYQIPNILQPLYSQCILFESNFIANLIKTIQLSYLDITLAIILQITNQQTADNLIVKINIGLALGFIIILLYLVKLSYSISQSHHLKLDNQHFHQRYSCFYEELKTDSKIAMIYSFVNLLRKTIFIVATVLLYNFPIFQTSVCFLSCLLNILLLLIGNPFIGKQQYILNLIPELCILLIIGTTIIFAFQDRFQILEDAKIYILGWVIALCIYISILLQLLFLLKEILVQMWNKFKNLIKYVKYKFNCVQ